MHFGVCGGCQHQHLPYDEQLAQKEDWICQLFGQAAPIIGCEEPWHWRNKMEFSFSQDREGNRYLGLMMRKRRGQVVTLSHCMIAQPWMVDTLHRVLAWWEGRDLEAYYPPKDRGALRTLTLREGIYTEERMVVLTLSGNSAYALTPDDLESFVEAVGPQTAVIARTQILAPKTATRFEERTLYGRDHIFEHLHDHEGKAYRFRIRAPSFFQPNTVQAERLCRIALKDVHDESCFLDLYCGTATLGILAASRARQVFGVEVVPEAVEDARFNQELNGIAHMTLLEGQVEHMLAGLPQPSTIIVDPPRVGLTPKALSQLLSLQAKKIIYISCNPESQKKNIDQMEGYEVRKVQPVDQFPHTRHVENIVFLESKS